MREHSEDTVLIVDDEPNVADLYAMHLCGQYDVRTAYDGNRALDELDDEVGVVLLDRRMEGLSGEEVLGEIRGRGLDCRVVMVTAVTPDFDIIDLAFDDYLVKPVSGHELHSTVEQMFLRSSYQDLVQTYFTLTSKYAALKTHKTTLELRRSRKFGDLERQMDEIRAELDAMAAEFAPEDFTVMFRDLVH